MERRNRSIEAFNKLLYIDSLDSEKKAVQLELWVADYLSSNLDFYKDLKEIELLQLSELYFKNISFLKSFRKQLKIDMEYISKQRKFLN